MKAIVTLKKEINGLELVECVWAQKVYHMDTLGAKVSVYELSDTQADNLFKMGVGMYWFSDRVELTIKSDLIIDAKFSND